MFNRSYHIINTFYHKKKKKKSKRYPLFRKNYIYISVVARQYFLYTSQPVHYAAIYYSMTHYSSQSLGRNTSMHFHEASFMLPAFI